jgi:predicted esterase
MSLVPAPGYPAVLDAAVDSLEVTARSAREVAAWLKDSSLTGMGLSITGVRATWHGVGERVDRAAYQYGQAAEALRDYALALRHVHVRMEAVAGDGSETLPWLSAPEAAALELSRVYAAALDDLDRAADLAIARISTSWSDVEEWANGWLRVVPGMAVASHPVLAPILAQRIASDVLAPTPSVTMWRNDGTAEQADARRQLDAMVPRSASDIVAGMALADRAGRSHKAVVDIAHLAAPDGDERWLVTLPSTQDWVFPAGDQPAPNDLDANLAMMLLPAKTRTQYERAVLVSMDQAGIEAGDSVMFAGFSQGGIVAARLASTLNETYSVGGVLAVGSPIDTFPINRDVPVLSVQHVFDPVHRLDLVHAVPQTQSRLTVWDGSGSAGSEPPLHASVAAAHNAANYALTTAYHDEDGSLSRMFGDFLLSEQRVADGWTLTRKQFQFAE